MTGKKISLTGLLSCFGYRKLHHHHHHHRFSATTADTLAHQDDVMKVPAAASVGGENDEDEAGFNSTCMLLQQTANLSIATDTVRTTITSQRERKQHKGLATVDDGQCHGNLMGIVSASEI